MTEPIKIEESATPSRVRVQIRYYLNALGGAMAAKGVMDESYFIIILGAILIVGPAVWADYATKIKHPLLVLGAETMPDSVARVKR